MNPNELFPRSSRSSTANTLLVNDVLFFCFIHSGSTSHSKGSGKRFDRSDDDDDDDFYDRTAKKKSAVKKTEQKADTHESLLEKLETLQKEMKVLKSRIDEYDANKAAQKQLEESGDLDAYMASLEKSGGDSKAKLQQNYGGMLKVRFYAKK